MSLKKKNFPIQPEYLCNYRVSSGYICKRLYSLVKKREFFLHNFAAGYKVYLSHHFYQL
jgi:hypothetical protein